VALTTSRSGIRRDHIHALLTLSHRNGDDGIKESKRFPAANRPVDGTGESPTERMEKITGKNTRTENTEGGEQQE